MTAFDDDIIEYEHCFALPWCVKFLKGLHQLPWQIRIDQKNMKVLALMFSIFSICQMVKAQNNIELDYIIYPHPLFPDIAIVDAEIVNNTDRDIYFLAQSCNHLDYYLTSIHKGAEVYILINCNASSPEKIKLAAHDKHSFASHISFQKGVSQAALKLKLIQLDSNTSLKGKTIDDLEKSYKHKTLNVQGPLATLDT